MILQKEEVLHKLKVMAAEFDSGVRNICIEVKASDKEDMTPDGLELFLSDNGNQ